MQIIHKEVDSWPLLHFSCVAYCCDDLQLVQRLSRTDYFVNLKFDCSHCLLLQPGCGFSSGRAGGASPPQLVVSNSGIHTQAFLLRSSRCQSTSVRHGRGAGTSHPTALLSVASSTVVGGRLESNLLELIWPSSELQKKSMKSRALTDEQR